MNDTSNHNKEVFIVTSFFSRKQKIDGQEREKKNYFIVLSCWDFSLIYFDSLSNLIQGKNNNRTLEMNI